MICRRRLHRFRTPKTLALLVVTLLFLGIFVTYSTLSHHDTGSSSPGSSSLPSMEKRKPRYKAAQQHPKQQQHGNSVLFFGGGGGGVDRNQMRSFLEQQFNSGLKVSEGSVQFNSKYFICFNQNRKNFLGRALKMPISKKMNN
ncbi:uncharacterized protein LOC143288282 [Babylonia areolata]|uniref:uncharacterized protein LOC143288282 n=1 Tax=Babylonia areolata TaxID=304850 RepID=UPI003FD2AC4B